MKIQTITALVLAALTASTISLFFTSSAFACDHSEEVELNRALVARQVEEREPSDLEGPFVADGERLYIFVDVYNPDDPDLTVTVVWHRVGTDREFSSELEIGESRRWRTWAYHTMRESQAGLWEVDIMDNHGCTLEHLEFEVVVESDNLSNAVAEAS